MLSLFDHAALVHGDTPEHKPDFEVLKGLNESLLPKTGTEARRIGSAYYFTGLACKRGHVAPRYTMGGSCSWCQRKFSAEKQGRAFNGKPGGLVGRKFRAEAVASNGSTYVPSRPCKHGHRLRWVSSGNCIECDLRVRTSRRDKAKEARILKEYGLKPEEHEGLFQGQGRACALCRTPYEQRSAMHVDHCHTTGKVRGLLCSKCNQALGLLNDNTTLLRKAMEYLDAHAS